MNQGLALAYLRCQQFSRMVTVASILLISVLKFAGVDLSISVQLIIALLALGIGIPHGAIDHLITLPSSSPKKFYSFVAGYVLLAIVAAAGIASWERIGFVAVVIMSALHFGFGDASFKNESRDFEGAARHTLITEIIYAIPAGAIPLLLPLTQNQTNSALIRINPALKDWTAGNDHLLRQLALVVALLAITFFLVTKTFDLAIDLILLIALSWLTPPLVAFAVYFGCWHAVRHTARLIPKLSKARASAERGDVGRALWAAIYPGLYALVGTLGIAALLMLFGPAHFAPSLLWASLVIVWALTVPHMLTTARFDLFALKPRS